MHHYKPVVLIILDGWGVAPDSEGNAVTRAQTPNFDKFLKNYPAMTIHASGNEVGLLFGEMGNSEVGHLNIGAGRVYYQTCPRINSEISNNDFFSNPALLSAILRVKKNKSRLHLIGLVSSGNVHSSNEHLYALLKMCKKHRLAKEVYVHAILDGRDTLYNSAKVFIVELQKKMRELKVGQVATLSGRYYAMDRDNRWDRTERAYRAIAQGEAERSAEDPLRAIEESYAKKNYDEEFVPAVIVKDKAPLAPVRNDDAVIFFNFRPDRARQLTKAFVLPGFTKFQRRYQKDLLFVTMAEFEKDLPVAVAFPTVVVHNCLSEVISKAGLKQFHIAETEKYAHVTFFLNGTIEDPFPGEDRLLVPSPRVASYDKKPEMSAGDVTKGLVRAIESKKYDFLVVNYANPDMVGHTGALKAGIAACEAADKGLGETVEHVLAHGGAAIITADHGNAEEMINLQTGEMDKEHSTNPVPFIIIAKNLMGEAGPSGDPPEGDLSLLRPVGVLADVAPTTLKLLGLEAPPEMTGRALI